MTDQSLKQNVLDELDREPSVRAADGGHIDSFHERNLATTAWSAPGVNHVKTSEP